MTTIALEKRMHGGNPGFSLNLQFTAEEDVLPAPDLKFAVSVSGVNEIGYPTAFSVRFDSPLERSTNDLTRGGSRFDFDAESEFLAADPEVSAMIAEGEEDIRHGKTVPGSELRKRD